MTDLIGKNFEEQNEMQDQLPIPSLETCELSTKETDWEPAGQEDTEEIFGTENEEQQPEAKEPQIPLSEVSEAADRAAHEEAEAKRKAEWEAKQEEKRRFRQAQLEKLDAMSDEEIMMESIKRVGQDTEKLTRRNMKECVSEYIQTKCLEDVAFARLAVKPQKSMIRCFQYINRKAYDYIQEEIKEERLMGGSSPMQMYASDIPDDLCYQWAEDYFHDLSVKEDREEEESFVPRPYHGNSVSRKKNKKEMTKKAKKTDTKVPIKRNSVETTNDGSKDGLDGQLSLFGQLSMENYRVSEEKAG